MEPAKPQHLSWCFQSSHHILLSGWVFAHTLDVHLHFYTVMHALSLRSNFLCGARRKLVKEVPG